jgi:hypothetical protein
MKKLVMIATLLFSSAAFASSWSNVVLIDQACSAKAKANPDAHTRSCAIQCSKSGYGILTQDGKFLKFDQKGNEEAAKLLSSTDKKDHLRVNVQGEEKDGTLAVTSLSF